MQIKIEKLCDRHYLQLPRQVPGYTIALGDRETLNLAEICGIANMAGEDVILPACGDYPEIVVRPKNQLYVGRTAKRQSHRGPTTGTQVYQTQDQINGFVWTRLHTTDGADGWGAWFLMPITDLPRDVAEELRV